MKNIFLILFVLLFSSKAFAQPANDNCATAQAIGNLPTPGACTGGLQDGAVTTVVGSNVGATPSVDASGMYTTGSLCEGGTTNPAGPALDVWYSFVPTGNILNINITGFAGVNFSLWTGSCGNLQSAGCSVDGAIRVEQINPGQTYWIQISGNSGTATDASFNINIDNDIDCNDCFRNGTLSVNPLPVNGMYPPNTTVNFCFHVDQWQQTSTNWLHGVQVSWGAGWQAAPVSTTPPGPYGGSGTWAWLTGCTSSATGQSFGQGFYWDNTDAGTNPGNNFGDPIPSGNTTTVYNIPANEWNFCWSLRTAATCNPGANLGVTINTSGDGESGGWGDVGCQDDPPTQFFAAAACCPPTMTSQSVTCNGASTGTAAATAVIGAAGAQNPYVFSWTGPSGPVATTTVTSGLTNSITNIPAGTYTVTLTDKNLCVTIATVVVTQPTVLAATVTPVNANCTTPGSVTTVVSGGTPAYTYTWTGASYSSNAQNPTGMSGGTYTLNMTDSKGCPLTKTVSITQTGTVTSTFSIPTATQCLVGNSFSFNNTGTAAASHQYSFSPSTGAPATSTQTNYVGTSFTTPGTYTVYHTVTSGICVNTTTNVVVINPNPSAVLTQTNPTCNTNNGVVLITDNSSSVPVAQNVVSASSSLGTLSGMTVTGLGASTPVITVTNNYGCTYTVSTTLTMTPFPTSLTTSTVSSTCGNSNGSLSFSTSTGVAPYTYSVNNNAATSPTTGLAAGTYTVKVSDKNGCTFSVTATIANIAGPTAINGNTTAAGCSLNNGSYNVTGVAGGTATYSFGVDGGAVSTASLVSNALSAGVHSIQVVDANGCSFTKTITIPASVGPTAITTATTLATCGSANGSATVTGVTGGTPTYSYSFNGGAFSTTSTVGSLAAGNYSVTVRDVNSCTLTVGFTISNNGSPTSTVTGFTNPKCAVGTNTASGSFSVSASGGSGAPFSYTLTTPFVVNGTGVFTGLPQGTYNINIKDAAGCITTASVTLTNPSVLTLTPTAIPAKCFATNTGTVNMAGSGGTPTYSYNLNGGAYQASSNFNNIGAAIYNMGIMDLNGCTATQTVQVTQPTALSQTITTTNANCTAANGTATTAVSGGTSPYFYSWTGGGGSSNVTNPLVTGNYSVTVTDANTCTLTGVANIGATISGTATITGSTNVTCFNATNGSLTAAMPGGTGPISYTWSPSGGNAATTSPIGAGTYTCFTRDAFGCTSSTQATLAQPTQLTVNMSSNNAKCFGTLTGTVSASGSGGVTPYTYLWSNTSTLSTVPGVGQGTYTVTVTDFNNCSASNTVTVNQPTAISLTSATTAATCNQANGSATVTPSGGVGGYSYNWSPASTSTTAVIGPIVAGTYTVIVTDANSCSQVLSTTIPNLSGPSIAIISSTNVSCFGGNNGAATTIVSGGTGSLSFFWAPSNLSTQNAANLLAGVHTVTVTDLAGCVASASVNITQPPVLTATVTPTDPKCNGATNGFGVVTVSGGTSPYTYAWATGSGTAATSPQYGAGNYGVITTDSKGCTVTSTMSLNNPPAMVVSITSTSVTCFGVCNGTAIGSATNNVGPVNYNWTGVGLTPITTQTLTGLCAGTYSLQAVDMNGCTATNQVIIDQPTQVTANISATGSITCYGGNDGFASATPGGGVGGYTFSWSAPSNATSSTANNLTAGPYTVTVTDGNNCKATTVATIIEPSPLSTTLTTANPKCNAVCNGTANVAYAGGAGSTTFLWLPGLQSGNNVSTLCAGNQSVIITSNGSCTTAITFTLTEPSALTAVLSATNSHCSQSDGAACAVVAGGTAPYQSTVWSNGPTTVCNNNIPAGAYTFTVTDANGCALGVPVSVNDIAGPTVVITGSTAVKCFGESNGTANANITGGTGTLSIVWTGTSPQITTANTTSLNAGPHSIIVTDEAGCIGTDGLTMTQPSAILSAIGSQTNVTCFGLSNGGATLLANGGTPNYTYSWSPSGQISDILASVGAGVHTCTITDFNGCTKTQTVSITEPAPVVMTSSVITNVKCNGGSDGQIATTVVGGSGAFSYSWSPSQPNSPVINGLTQGTYSLVVTDTRSCSISNNFTVLEPSPLITSSNTAISTCGLPNGTATVGVIGGTTPYTLVWNTPTAQSGSVAVGLPANSSWTCTVVDNNNCSTTQSVNIGSAPSPTITGFVVKPPTCFGYLDGTITVNYTSGTPNYQVAWSSPISQTVTAWPSLTHSVSNVGKGIYSATVTDANGCVSTMPVSVSQPTILTLLDPVATRSLICFGETSQLSASASGGTAPYSYTWTPLAGTGVGPGPHTVTLTTTTNYNINVTDANNCPAQPRTITVAVTPSLSLQATQPFTVCVGDPVNLVPAIGSPGRGAPYTYAWSHGPTASSVTVNGFLPSPNNYTVTVDDGCTNPKASAVFTVVVNDLPIPNFNPVAPGCAPLTFTLNGTSTGPGSSTNDIFYWNVDKTNFAAAGNPTIVTLSDTGKHNVTLTVTNPSTGCQGSITKPNHIEIYPKPTALFAAIPPIGSILEPTITFTNMSVGATSYYWDFGDPVATNGSNNSILVDPVHTYSLAGDYEVHLVATNDKGCRDIAKLPVEITPDFAIYIPNTFTPDGNGLNDFFQPQGIGINEDNYRLDVFDRWGENIFTSNSFRKGWDGTVKGNSKLAEQGVYVYKCVVYDLKGNKHPFVGHVTLLRQNQ